MDCTRSHLVQNSSKPTKLTLSFVDDFSEILTFSGLVPIRYGNAGLLIITLFVMVDGRIFDIVVATWLSSFLKEHLEVMGFRPTFLMSDLGHQPPGLGVACSPQESTMAGGLALAFVGSHQQNAGVMVRVAG